MLFLLGLACSSKEGSVRCECIYEEAAICSEEGRLAARSLGQQRSPRSSRLDPHKSPGKVSR